MIYLFGQLLHVTPWPKDAEELTECRARLGVSLRVHRAREVRIICGDADEAIREAYLRDKHLTSVLRGPRCVIQHAVGNSPRLRASDVGRLDLTESTAHKG